MRPILKKIALLLLLVPGYAGAATDPQSCLVCHGETARSSSQAPALDGQSASYLAKQLQQFKLGQRGAETADTNGQLMAAVAKPLSDEDIQALAAHFSALDAAKSATQPADPALVDKGRRIFVGSCATCHGGKAEGNEALRAPAIAALSPDYLQLQLRHFQSGLRGQHKTDKPGRQMAMMARTLTDADLQAISVYIGAGLP